MMRKNFVRIIPLAAALLIISGCKGSTAHITAYYADHYDSPQQFMEGIYTADHTVEIPSRDHSIRGVIVPHHLTATVDIAAGIAMLQHQSFSRILLISPDHFHKCPTVLCTVNGVYDTQFGTVKADPAAVDALASSPLTTVSPDLFTHEHGIYADLPYIKHYFPSVPVTPIALSQDHPWRNQTGSLLSLIASAADPQTIVIVSSDFSHYLPLKTANEMDEKTAETLFSKDLNGLEHLKDPSQSDCPSCLWLLASLADEKHFYNPSVIMHTNSATILHDPAAQSTTSHFAMVWYENSPLTSSDVTVGGDVTVTRDAIAPHLSPEMNAFWSGSGVRLVNLEGPLSDTCPQNQGVYSFCNALPVFKGITQIATDWGIMNNHMLDQHLSGVAATKQLLKDLTETPVEDQVVSNANVRMIAVTSLLNSVSDVHLFDLQKDNERVLTLLRSLPKEKGTLTIVLVHGGIEYRSLVADDERHFLETFIDAGADSVVESHSHVQGDVFLYKDKPIFEGVGNFLFDQKDSLATSTAKAVRLRSAGHTVDFQTLVTPD